MTQQSQPTVALSIRQPYAELILRGIKRIEYRSRPTSRRGTIFIYASRTPGPVEAFRCLKLQPDDLPVGVIVGSVCITDCIKGQGCFQWHLAGPQRCAHPRRPVRRQMPTFFYPFDGQNSRPDGEACTG